MVVAQPQVARHHLGAEVAGREQAGRGRHRLHVRRDVGQAELVDHASRRSGSPSPDRRRSGPCARSARPRPSRVDRPRPESHCHRGHRRVGLRRGERRRALERAAGRAHQPVLDHLALLDGVPVAQRGARPRPGADPRGARAHRAPSSTAAPSSTETISAGRANSLGIPLSSARSRRRLKPRRTPADHLSSR